MRLLLMQPPKVKKGGPHHNEQCNQMADEQEGSLVKYIRSMINRGTHE